MGKTSRFNLDPKHKMVRNMPHWSTRGFPACQWQHTMKIRLLLVLGILTTALSAESATNIWDGGGGNSNWANGPAPANWNPDGAPANNGTADLIFAGSVKLTPNQNINYN